MKYSILFIVIGLAFCSCQNTQNSGVAEQESAAQTTEREILKFADLIGDTLRYDVGDPVFDIVISSDTTLYWRSLNPKYGTEAHEDIVIIPISDHENMVSYVEKSGPGVCWYNDFERGITTVSVFLGKNMMTFSGTVERKHRKE